VAPPSQLRADIPEDLERVVLKCLEKDADQRFRDAESLEVALGQCRCVGDWGPVQAALWWRDSVPSAESQAASDGSSEPTEASPGRRRMAGSAE
jgi:serine/threonine-protein kinase